MELSSIVSLGLQNLTVNEDIGSILIPIARTDNIDLAVSVDYSINDDSARAGEDYLGTPSGTVNFAPGDTIAEIPVTILDDGDPETDESFNLAIGNPREAVLGDIRTAIITIEDNDVITEDTLAFAQAEYSVQEAENTATITVVRTGDTDETVSVNYATGDNSARAGLDYTAVSGTLNFAPGDTTQTFEIPLLDDSLPEINEALTLTLSNPEGIDLGLQNTAQLIIEEDDEVPFTIRREVIVSGLRAEGVTFRQSGPTAFDWSEDGTMFIGKLDGVVQVFDGDTLLEEPFIDLSDQVNTGGQRGLLGLAVHPNFPEEPYIYLSFSYDPPGVIPDLPFEGRLSRLVRVEADPATDYKTALPNSEVILLETPPVFNSHGVGAIHFGLNGELFFAHGDGVQVGGAPRPEQAEIVQSLDNAYGKLFRIDPITGEGYADNPFYNGDPTQIESKIYSYGLRNPWRYTIHPETGEPFIGDVGWANWEEINTGKGSNFGWPLYEGGNGVSLRTTAIAESPAFQDLYAAEPDVTAPFFALSHSIDEARSITVGDFYTGDAYPEIYQGALFFSDYGDDSGVEALTFDEEGNVDSVLNFADEQFISQIAMGPDSYLYFSNLITGEIGRWVLSAPLSNPPTNGDDFITGTDDDDVISSLDGNDTANGEAGNDFIQGNRDNDLISGGPGDDTLEGNQNRDRIFGDGDNDLIDGGPDDDSLIGGLGDDTAYGANGNDSIRGEFGNDLLRGGTGNDTILGALGDDIIRGGTGNDTLEGNQDRDRIFGDGDNDLIDGGPGDDLLFAGTGDDTAHGANGNDSIQGELGNDILRGGTGDDSIQGELGDDIIRGGTGNDTLEGNQDNDRIYGDWDNDLIDGGPGDDTIRGGTGDDTAYGANGNDWIRGQLGNDILRGGTGDDLIQGELGNDILRGGTGNDTLSGGAGADTLEGNQNNDLFVYTAASDSLINQPDTIADFTVGSDKLLLDFATFTPIEIGSVSNINEANTYFDGSSIQVAFSASESILYVDSVAQGVADMAINLNNVTSLSLSDFA